MNTIDLQLNEIVIQYGYWGIFMSLLFGIIGLPIPDETLMTFIGYSIYLGNLSYISSIMSAFLGSILGSTINYFVGLKLGLPFLKKYGPKVFITEKKIIRSQQIFDKYGGYFIFFGYFIPGIRHLAAYLAGVSAISYRKFCSLAYSGALLWCLIFINLGFVLGNSWVSILEQASTKALFFLIGLFFIVLASLAILFKKIKM